MSLEEGDLPGADVQTYRQSGDDVRRRLGVCLFLQIAGAAILTQVYPKVVLDYYRDDDAKASQFNGWLTGISSAIQLIAIPGLSGASDIFGRRRLIAGSLGVHAVAVIGLAAQPNSIVAVAACQIVTGVCNVILPVSQAIIIDLASSEEDGGEVSHGLGLIGAAFGLAVAVGPILGGGLSEHRRRLACLICAAASVLAFLSLKFYGWEETAPGHGDGVADNSTNARYGDGPKGKHLLNPFTVFKVFFDSRTLLRLAISLFLFATALNVYVVWYNYFDFKFDWSALDISYFFSIFGIVVAFVSGVGIRCLVPNRLTEKQGVLVGLVMQVGANVLYGLSNKGWLIYAILLATVLQFITEPCIQAIMAKLIDADRQGSLQGAVMSLRILAQGTAAPIYGQVFSFGLSTSFRKAFHTSAPALPFSLAATIGAANVVLGWGALRKWKEPSDSDTNGHEVPHVAGPEEGAVHYQDESPESAVIFADGGMPYQAGAPQALAAMATTAIMHDSEKHGEESMTVPLLQTAPT